MKILEVVFKDPRTNPGGVEAVSLTLSRFLNEHGVEVITIFQVYSKPMHSFDISDSMVGIGTPLPDRSLFLPFNKIIFNILLLLYFRRHCREFDGIHINGDVGSLLTSSSSVRTLVTLHGSSLLTYRKTAKHYGIAKRLSILIVASISHLLELYGLSHGSRILSVSKQVNDAFLNYTKNKQSKVIYNGVNTNLFRPPYDKTSLRISLGLPSEGPLAIWVGKNPARKGLNTAIRAVEGTSSFKLITVGNFLMQLESKERVIQYGSVDRETLMALYQASDVFLFPSLYEGFSVAVLEGMSSGLVPVIYRSNSSSEILEDGFNACVLDNAEQFPNTLKFLEEHPGKMKQMGLNAREIAVTHSAEVMCNLYLMEMNDLFCPARPS